MEEYKKRDNKSGEGEEGLGRSFSEKCYFRWSMNTEVLAIQRTERRMLRKREQHGQSLWGRKAPIQETERNSVWLKYGK